MSDLNTLTVDRSHVSVKNHPSTIGYNLGGAAKLGARFVYSAVKEVIYLIQMQKDLQEPLVDL